jgi:ABC-type Fe3+-siderophore transport system permease subunit
MLAPISNPHHPLSREAYKRNKLAGQTLTGIESAISISTDLLLAQTDVAVLPIASASIAAVAVMMIIPKIAERRETGRE